MTHASLVVFLHNIKPNEINGELKKTFFKLALYDLIFSNFMVQYQLALHLLFNYN